MAGRVGRSGGSRSRARSRRGGHALLAALVVSMFVGALGLVVASLGGLSSRRASASRDEDQLRSACRAGLAQARAVLWDAYERAGSPTRDGVRAHLDGLGLEDGDTRWLGQGGVALVDSTAVAFVLRSGPGVVVGTTEVQVSARRLDAGDDTLLFLRADAAHGAERRHAEEVVRLGRRLFEGFRYALLGDSIDRVLDRATFDNAERARLGVDGPHDRVKVGALGALRPGPTPRTTIAGTLYAAGPALDPGGSVIAAPGGGTNGIRAEGIDASDGTLTGPPLGDLVDWTPDGTPYGNFYANYPAEPDEQVDGYFPSGGIPSPIPDDDGDRVIDDAEWGAFAADKGGRLNQAVLLAIPDTSTLPLIPIGLPSLGNILQFDGAPAGTNLLVVGTALTPSRIDGDVAVDGDLVITGPITGVGTFYVRGNIYLLGDVTYARPADDTVAFVAGGSIVAGDYKATPPLLPPIIPPVLPTLVSDVAMTGFVSQELAAFNRMEWTRTQPNYDPVAQRPTSDPTGVPNSAYVPGYVPRFYAFGGGAAPRMFLGSSRWRNDTQTWLGALGDPDTTIDTSAYGGAFVVRPLDPTSGWIHPITVTLLQNVANLLRPPGTTRIDGLLFSADAVLLRAPASGKVRIMGGVVARDVGVQAPGGLRIDYDDRVRSLVKLPEATPEAIDAFVVLRSEP